MGAPAAHLFSRVDAYEHRLCLRLNRTCQWAPVRHFFAIVSRLGDGVFWYATAVLLPIAYGASGAVAAARMAVTGVIGVALYKYLKTRLVRERPYIALFGIVPGTPALDRYSFPSGHTLHAVSFSILIVSDFPELATLIIPFTCLVAASRVILGLHYPTDVAAGALLGSFLAILAIVLV